MVPKVCSGSTGGLPGGTAPKPIQERTWLAAVWSMTAG